jgi:hypothetical protein
MVGKIRNDKLRLKINLRTDIKTSKQPFMYKVGMPSSSTDFDGPRRFVALGTFEIQTEAVGAE